MNISIKGKNEYLIIKMNETISFDQGLFELEELLEKLTPYSVNFYPKALFDFGCRNLSNEEFSRLFLILLKKQRLLFCGFVSKEKERKEIVFLKKDIHNGEVLHLKEDTLLQGNINPGAYVYFDRHLYVLGRVSGTLIGTKPHSMICAQSLRHANIYILEHCFQDVTHFALTSFYIKDNQLISVEGGTTYG